MKNARLQAIVVLAAGALLGYVAASGNFRLSRNASAAPAAAPADSFAAPSACCMEGDAKEAWLAHADAETPAKNAAPPGSPGATTTIDGKYLPNPAPKFGGTINLNAKDSKPWWPPNVVPPKGAPNVLLIMTDDQGYGVSGTFGGVVPTPTMDRIAKA